MPDLPEHQPADLKEATAPRPVTPAWLAADPCPSWCAGDHPAEEHPEDRAHMVGVYVPVVRTGGPAFRSGKDPADAVEYVIVMRRYEGQADTWVYIGEGERTTHSIEVTVESARRLVVTLGELLAL